MLRALLVSFKTLHLYRSSVLVCRQLLTLFWCILQLLLVSDGWLASQKLTRAPPMATMTTSRNESSVFRDCFNPKGTNATSENSKVHIMVLQARSEEGKGRMSNRHAYLILCSCYFFSGGLSWMTHLKDALLPILSTAGLHLFGWFSYKMS